MDNENTGSSIGRRDILKKSAVVAATAWTAPMIVSSKVGASSGGTCLPGDCQFYYLVKIDAGGGCDDSFPNNPGFGAGGDLEQDCHVQFEHLLDKHRIREVRSGGCHNVVTVGANTGSLLEIKLRPEFRLKFALRKQGQGCMGECGPSTGDPVCDRDGAPTYTFSCGEYSNMILVVCGPDEFGAPLDAYKAFSEPSSLETQSLETEGSEDLDSAGALAAETTEVPEDEMTESSDTETQETETPDTETQETETQDTETQETETQETETQDPETADPEPADTETQETLEEDSAQEEADDGEPGAETTEEPETPQP